MVKYFTVSAYYGFYINKKLEVKMEDSEILKSREVIKKQLPKLYDYHWQFRDQNKLEKFEIPDVKLHNRGINCDLIYSGSKALYWSYRNLFTNISFSWAANKTANDMEVESLANYFRYRIRNLHTQQSIRDFFRFLDHATFHLNELSSRKLLDVKLCFVSFDKLKKKNDENNFQGVVDEIIQGKNILLDNAFSSIATTPDVFKLLKKIRNIEAHRFPLGIDCITQLVSRDDARLIDKHGVFMRIGDLNYFGIPDMKFQEIEPILKVFANNAKKIIQGFFDIGLMAFGQE